MKALVIAEHDNQNLKTSTLNTLTAALALSEQCELLVVGHQCQSVANEAARLDGVSRVILVDSPSYKHQLAEEVAPTVAELATNYHYVLAPASTQGKNLLPRVAALLDVGQTSDLCQIVSQDTFVHPIYAGNAMETVRMLDPIKCLTVRTTAFDAAGRSEESAELASIEINSNLQLSSFVSSELSVSERPELGSARVIVSGGRGLGEGEKFKLIEQLADKLGAAVGASRAAVDAGFIGNDHQVGQTGKVVAPELYIAVGISGAIQHMAGMQDSKVIVAINKDEDAPIFQIATYGLVGDLFKIVPELIDKLNSQ